MRAECSSGMHVGAESGSLLLGCVLFSARRHTPPSIAIDVTALLSSVLHSVGLPLRAAIVRATRTDFPGLRTSRPAVCGQHISGSLIQVRVSQEAWTHVLTERSLALTPLWLSNSGSSLQLTTN